MFSRQVLRRGHRQIFRRGHGDAGVERAVLVRAPPATGDQALRRRQGRVPRRRRKRVQQSGEEEEEEEEEPSRAARHAPVAVVVVVERIATQSLLSFNSIPARRRHALFRMFRFRPPPFGFGFRNRRS